MWLKRSYLGIFQVEFYMSLFWCSKHSTRICMSAWQRVRILVPVPCGLIYMSSQRATLCVWGRSLFVIHYCAHQANLPRTFQDSCVFNLDHTTGILGITMCTAMPSFTLFRGSEARSSCLHGKHFACWSMSSAPLGGFDQQRGSCLNLSVRMCSLWAKSCALNTE